MTKNTMEVLVRAKAALDFFEVYSCLNEAAQNKRKCCVDEYMKTRDDLDLFIKAYSSIPPTA